MCLDLATLLASLSRCSLVLRASLGSVGTWSLAAMELCWRLVACTDSSLFKLLAWGWAARGECLMPCALIYMYCCVCSCVCLYTCVCARARVCLRVFVCVAVGHAPDWSG